MVAVGNCLYEHVLNASNFLVFGDHAPATVIRAWRIIRNLSDFRHTAVTGTHNVSDHGRLLRLTGGLRQARVCGGVCHVNVCVRAARLGRTRY